MNIDAVEGKAFTEGAFDASAHLKTLHSAFGSELASVNGSYENFGNSITATAGRWLGNESLRGIQAPTVYDNVKKMYSGVENNWQKTLGLEEISKWKVNPDYYYQNIKQQSGYAAEVISTAKENIEAATDRTGITTYRADDRPDLFSKNDQYVDKIRVDQNGNIIERIQTKFVGRNAEKCLEKLTCSRYDKYFNDGMIDKMEVPGDYYDDIKNAIPDKIAALQKQLERAEADGNETMAGNIQKRIDRYNKIDRMLEKSTVTSDEAVYARMHPNRYVTKIFAREIVSAGNTEGLKSGAAALALTAAVSTIDNVQRVMNGELTPEDAATDIVKDTAVAGGAGYGTAFISTAVSQAMASSSRALIQSAGNAGVPAAVISFGVVSYDSVKDYAQGTISVQELAEDLGGKVVNVAGGAIGTALAGAALGSVVPGAGTAAGFAAGMIGGLVGTAIASEAYATAVQYGPGAAKGLADKAETVAERTLETVKTYAPAKVESVKAAFNDYFNANEIPIHI